MESYEFLLFLAIILITTKFLGLCTKKIHMPQVVGALVAGILLGPSGFNIVVLDGSVGSFLEYTAEIGVVFLMFGAGLGTDLKEFKKNGVSALIIAAIGVIVPVLGGFLGYYFYFDVSTSDMLGCLKAVFIGVVLSATSVSITVETLREMGKLQGKVGTTILGAAVIDDILGIVVLTIVTSLQGSSTGIGLVLLKILLYFVFIAAVALVMVKGKKVWIYLGNQHRTAVFAVAFCLLLSYCSEAFFGVADITGAYFAGLILCTMDVQGYINEKVNTASYLFFSPVFFASIGLKTSLAGFTGGILGFALLLLVIAILSKIMGCGLGAKVCGFSGKEALQVGVGMISRGEVALIVAQKGYQCGMLDDSLFAPVVLVVIVTTLITPILLKFVMADKENAKSPESSEEKTDGRGKKIVRSRQA